MLLPLPPRDPQSPVNARQLRAIAASVMELVSTIRDYLPVLDDTEAKSHPQVLDQWYSHAGGAYTRIERLRNPQQLPWPGPRGSFSTEGPEGAAECYMEICYNLEPIVEHYGWQGVSDGSQMPNSGVYRGETVPPIDDRLLRAVEKPARKLLDLTEGMQAWDYDDEDPVEPTVGKLLEPAKLTGNELYYTFDSLKRDFQENAVHGYRGAYWFRDGKILMFGCGEPIDPLEEDGPMIVSTKEIVWIDELNSLIERAGVLLFQLPSLGTKNIKRRHFIRQHKSGVLGWVAYLTTGMGQKYTQEHPQGKQRVWIDDIARASANSISYLMSHVLSQAADRKDNAAMPELKTAEEKVDGPNTTTDNAKDIKTLEEKTPELDRDNGQWVRNKRAAILDGLATETLKRYRHDGIKNAESTLGRDSDGRVWRRSGTPGSHPLYLRSSLTSQQQ